MVSYVMSVTKFNTRCKPMFFSYLLNADSIEDKLTKLTDSNFES